MGGLVYAVFPRLIKSYNKKSGHFRAFLHGRTEKSSFFDPNRLWAVVFVLLVVGMLGLPKGAHAWNPFGIFSAGTVQADAAPQNEENSQTVSLLEAKPTIDPQAKAIDSVEIVDGSALVAESGPLGTAADIALDTPASDQISVYTVHKGDTVATIAKMFGVSANTILWANDLAKGQALVEGRTLVILPVTGVQYTIKKGDTLASIAKKFSADVGDITVFNGIAPNTMLAVGDTIIIPDGVISTQTASSSGAVSGRVIAGSGGPAQNGYYIKPVACPRTQGLHGHNGTDWGCSVGTSVRASASGTVIVASGSGGYNGGYGNYIVISHPNGTQTLYAHLSKVVIGAGDIVKQGQIIGTTGGRPGTFGAGKSTGAHLHFEVRGAKNPGVDSSWAVQ